MLREALSAWAAQHKTLKAVAELPSSLSSHLIDRITGRRAVKVKVRAKETVIAMERSKVKQIGWQTI